jgi:hypothetical protein
MGGDVGYLVVMVQMSHVGLGDTNIPSRWDGLLRFASRVGATKMASRWDAVVGWAFRWGVPVGRVGMLVINGFGFFGGGSKLVDCLIWYKRCLKASVPLVTAYIWLNIISVSFKKLKQILVFEFYVVSLEGG